MTRSGSWCASTSARARPLRSGSRQPGLRVNALGDKVTIGQVRLGSQAAKFGLQFGDTIAGVEVPADRPSRYWFALPAILLLGLVAWLQRRRSGRVRKTSPAALASS